jgi:hypothetical protein
LLEEEGKRRG